MLQPAVKTRRVSIVVGLDSGIKYKISPYPYPYLLISLSLLSESVRLRKSNEGIEFLLLECTPRTTIHHPNPANMLAGYAYALCKPLAAHREKNDLERGRHYRCTS